MEDEWLKNPNWWFNASPADDLYISNKFSYLLDETYLEKKLSPIEIILIYDQLPRHIFRNQPCSHIIGFFLIKALEVPFNINYLNSLDAVKFTFSLLPWRHIGEVDYIYEVINLCWDRIKKEDHPILRRFLKASYERCPLVGSTLKQSDIFNKNILEFAPPYDPIEPGYDFFKNKSNNYENRKLILSISGGVDSMMCSWLLKDKIHAAIHINYNNRATSDDESKFVVWWCNKLGIKCYVRKIHEIQREPCMKYGLRNTYESYTRNIRYNCYKEFGNDAVIVLGHNKDDILENIFTNIANKTKYENLDGMEFFSEQDGINFARPLLILTKIEIFKFAQSHNIPYLPCSTPSWSQRGQIRTNVVPILNQWFPDFTESIYHLSKSMRDMHKFISYTIDNIVSNAIKNECSFQFKLDILYDTEFFWRNLLMKFEIYNVSTRSIINLCNRIQKNKESSIIVVLNKTTTITINTISNIVLLMQA
jgi:tRNA(Ile)-lysidine synthetase-like protein